MSSPEPFGLAFGGASIWIANNTASNGEQNSPQRRDHSWYVCYRALSNRGGIDGAQYLDSELIQ